MKKGFSISKVRIYGLFQTQEVEVDFSKNIQIFIGENGVGKTTILNIIYHALKLDFEKLKELPFEVIQILFENKKSLILSREWLENYKLDWDFTEANLSRRLAKVLKIYDDVLENKSEKSILNPFKQLRSLKKDLINSELIFKELEQIDFRLLNQSPTKEEIYTEYIGEDLPRYFYDYNDQVIYEDEIRMNLFCYVIKLFLKESILYFPTYRRIEEDLSKLTIPSETFFEFEENLEGDELIGFGLNDVKQLINKIEDEIREFNLEGFSQINGQLLKYFLNPEQITHNMIENLKNKELVDVVLSRMQDETLNRNEKEIIKNRLDEIINDNNFDNNDKVIIYFINKLIETYEMKSEQETAIKDFVKICNSYFNNKKFYYNQNKIKVEVINLNTKKPIELENLSSGEKQIVSTFAKIYLQKNNQEYLILFDEPELSLSVEWQMKFLPDIMSSKSCKKMMVVTHSPFIYRNELKQYARSIENIISTNSKYLMEKQ